MTKFSRINKHFSPSLCVDADDLSVESSGISGCVGDTDLANEYSGNRTKCGKFELLNFREHMNNRLCLIWCIFLSPSVMLNCEK